ncbi:MAG: flagellar biosynthetic protein FliO, partial [Planctomycetes bacterium]|nr:flagellar biosynthetic protein FliO [Planctomycetota bacterium]
AATIGVVLALQPRSRPRAPSGSWVFEVLQSTPLDGAGRLVAVRFGGRVLLVAADRNGGRLLAEAVAEDEPVVELPRAAPRSVPAIEPVAAERVSAYRSLARAAAADTEFET